VSTRTYLSIGDVLSLLRQEFPDITISKIRFLESQGLVDPERSPSGYRKFYEHDVERLRWVLRQQREHFLPLKVIRDRLARSGDISTDMEDFDAEAVSEADEESEISAFEAAAETFERDAVELEVPEVGAVNGTYTEDVIDDTWEEPIAAAPAASSAPAPTALAARPTAVRTTPLPDRDPPLPEAEPVAALVVEPSPPVPAEPAPRTIRGREGSAESVHAVHVSGASMTLDELCAASGLGATEVASLEGFGMIEPIVVGGALYYDEDCLTVAKLAGDFARYGIEPRHLRLFRNAADRELGLIEQVVTPLLRQRNPEARQRALDAADELSRLGGALRGAIVRRALRHHFGA
jgi:DNA-binding transcriptional MerR regulator